ncbi:MAG: hypothetical protein ABL986_03140 [Vicinamibacterales bacterium]
MKRAVILIGVLTVSASTLAAQGPPGRGGRGGPPPTAQAQAPMDLTGQWVSVITEDWRWRMTTPQKGDYGSVPLNAEGRRVADTWDLAKDAAAGEQCRAFGAAAIMRMPTRVRISWQDDATLKVETDAGQQTRLLRFAAPGPSPATATASQPEWQGVSAAEWNKQAVSRGLGFGGGRGVVGGNLKVTTTRMRSGYLRKNGVPYSENAVVTEYYNRHDEPNGDNWFTVTTIVEDPRFLAQPFITSSHFKKEADAAKWSPTPCQVDPPR